MSPIALGQRVEFSLLGGHVRWRDYAIRHHFDWYPNQLGRNVQVATPTLDVDLHVHAFWERAFGSGIAEPAWYAAKHVRHRVRPTERVNDI